MAFVCFCFFAYKKTTFDPNNLLRNKSDGPGDVIVLPLLLKPHADLRCADISYLPGTLFGLTLGRRGAGLAQSGGA